MTRGTWQWTADAPPGRWMYHRNDGAADAGLRTTDWPPGRWRYEEPATDD